LGRHSVILLGTNDGLHLIKNPMGDPAGVIEEDEDTFGLDDQDKSITG